MIAEDLIKQKEEHKRQMLEKREFYEEHIREDNAKAAEKLEKLEREHEEKTEEMDRSQQIPAHKFAESNKKLQRLIRNHKGEMDGARDARIQAQSKLQAIINSLTDFQARQAEKEKEWQADRIRDQNNFKERMRVEREKSAQKEAKIMERMNKAAEKVEGNKSPSKGLCGNWWSCHGCSGCCNVEPGCRCRCCRNGRRWGRKGCLQGNAVIEGMSKYFLGDPIEVLQYDDCISARLGWLHQRSNMASSHAPQHHHSYHIYQNHCSKHYTPPSILLHSRSMFSSNIDGINAYT